jgi:hypothetical protein
MMDLYSQKAERLPAPLRLIARLRARAENGS